MGATEAESGLADTVRAGYAFEGVALELGGLLLDADHLVDVPVRIPIAMLNRHGLIAGATGTGKTRTLQLLVEQLSARGVPVFAADIKGDLSGLAQPGEPSEKLTARAATLGQQWTATGFPVEFYAIGGVGSGLPLRVTMSAFGPTLLSKLLGLQDQGGDVFFGEPELDTADLLQVAPDGRGLVSLVELPQLQDRPAI